MLITGAGGSIGSELARQIHRFGPASSSCSTATSRRCTPSSSRSTGTACSTAEDTVLADIRDAEALARGLRHHRPEVVFHAAALKHLPLLEQHPGRGLEDQRRRAPSTSSRPRTDIGVEHFVNISTDKAADPTSVLGTTKRLAERLTAWYGRATGRRYITVRFGNVLGTRGSMLHTFNAQIEQGGPSPSPTPTSPASS